MRKDRVTNHCPKKWACNTFHKDYFVKKRKPKFSQELFKQIFINQIDNAAQVVSAEHQPHIGTGSFYSFFCADIVEAPLAFNDAVIMFYDGLALFINLGVCFNVFFVLFKVRLIFAAFYEPAFFIECANCKCRAAKAFVGFIMFYKIDITLLAFLIPVAVSGKCLLPGAGVSVAVFIINKFIKVVSIIGCKGSYSLHGHHYMYTCFYSRF